MVSRRSLVAGLGLASLAPMAVAQPARPVRIVVPFPPGGSNDNLARALAERLQAKLGHPFLVDNRPGAGGTIGAALAANAPGDGQTLLFTSSGLATAVASQNVPFDPLELIAVAKVAEAPMVVLAAPDFDKTTIPAIVAAAKAAPGRLLFGTGGQGDATHFAAALLTMAAGIEVEYVPYAGMAQAQTDLLASRINLMVTTRASMGGAIDAGRVKVVAYTGPTRAAEAPSVPTVREGGVDYDFSVWWGLLAPKGTPAAVQAEWNRAVGEILQDPAYLTVMRNAGVNPSPASTADFTALAHADIRRYREAAPRMGLRPG